MSEVHKGDRVRFWTIETGLSPQYGIVQELFQTAEGIPYAKIIPESKPEHPKYLCPHAVWGFEPVEQEQL